MMYRPWTVFLREKDFLYGCRPFYCHASGKMQSVAQTGIDEGWAKGGKSEN
ncbi:MAG: hypothetical protein NC416_13980 [Eubacterium sp.]|nr:hypothetical protein [Eubacterium sp.]